MLERLSYLPASLCKNITPLTIAIVTGMLTVGMVTRNFGSEIFKYKTVRAFTEKNIPYA